MKIAIDFDLLVKWNTRKIFCD